MDRINSRIAQVYGYAVCLICVIVILVSLGGIINAAFDLSDPVRVSGGQGRFGTLTSFELYKLDARRSRGMAAPGSNGSVDSTLSDADLRKLFDAEREQQIGNATFHAERSLVSGIVFMLIAGFLFSIHWRWIKRSNLAAATEAL